MLYKHSFSILCGHLNLNQKRNFLNLAGYQSNRPINQSNRPLKRSNRPVYRYESFAQRILNSNLGLTGFRPNRSDIPIPDPAGLAGPVGNLNPTREVGRGCPGEIGWVGLVAPVLRASKRWENLVRGKFPRRLPPLGKCRDPDGVLDIQTSL